MNGLTKQEKQSLAVLREAGVELDYAASPWAIRMQLDIYEEELGEFLENPPAPRNRWEQVIHNGKTLP
jgi:hypothetical protein